MQSRTKLSRPSKRTIEFILIARLEFCCEIRWHFRHELCYGRATSGWELQKTGNSYGVVQRAGSVVQYRHLDIGERVFCRSFTLSQERQVNPASYQSDHMLITHLSFLPLDGLNRIPTPRQFQNFSFSIDLLPVGVIQQRMEDPRPEEGTSKNPRDTGCCCEERWASQCGI